MNFLINKQIEYHYNYFPKAKEELKKIIKERIKKEGNECDLNDIDVSKITDMSSLFEFSEFNGDISEWNVSNVVNMSFMFENSKFDKDISSWNVSNVKNMDSMFKLSIFNQDISSWDVSNAIEMSFMFENSKFDKDISSWNNPRITKSDCFGFCWNSPLKNHKSYLPGFILNK